MLLKRHYEFPENWRPEQDTEGRITNPPPISYIEVKHTGVHAEQNFSRRFVEAGVRDGWITLSMGKLIIHAQPEDLNYMILRAPGHYCCHCGIELQSDATGAACRAHIEAAHAGDESPDRSNPLGWRATTGYECVLDETQHERFKVPPYATVSHWRREH
jgi:hypothetical protein